MDTSDLLWFASALILLTNGSTLAALAPASLFRRSLFEYSGGLALSGLALLILSFRERLPYSPPVSVSNSLLVLGVLMIAGAVLRLFGHAAGWRSLLALIAVLVVLQFLMPAGPAGEPFRYGLVLVAVLISVSVRIVVALRRHDRSERGPVLLMCAVLGINALMAAANLAALVLEPESALRSQRQGVMALAIALISVIAMITTMLIVNSRTHAALRRLADSDDLTGALNRRAFFEQAAPTLRGAPGRRVAMLDFDHFKQINDRHGHRSGDTALSAGVGDVLTRLDGHGLVGRLGGEEFAMVWAPDGPAPDELRAALSLAASRATGVPITVSMGTTLHREGEPLETALHRADEALYRAKAEGRDRCLSH
ncbi:MAG: GGDEF domain-containing protein [Rhodanobacteraceae bacterium]|jgi:diguanylate cyclase (GGDEF)-like protein|nr:GGDEF domain-containing protein [Rhodanobacteraceae bacterium]MBL0041350.1 GGDEF domain-containing protein [Xanthomonadales bacterium]MBP6077438.1 GGDEF domain-containing protein [Xanthomonadales bacterium]MBP7623231.1 GGDEF domain-containing protein [Xanthomonadales bacterium]